MNDPQSKALLKSATSMVLKLMVRTGLVVSESSDIRDEVEDGLVELMNSIDPDPTGWSNPEVSGKYFYDVYLAMREMAGEQTEHDLVRPGLIMGNFTDSGEYYKHCMRISDRRKNVAPDEMKTCSICGQPKPANKFKHKGGARCFSCLGKIYRQRKAEKQ